MRTTLERRRSCLLAAFTLAVLAGCHDDTPPIGFVSGTVTRGGQPVGNLTVNFMPHEGRPSWGLTDADGAYTLHYDEDHEGAEVGPHKVSVGFVPGSPDEEAARAKGTLRLPADQQAITEKYGDFETTPLTFEVKDGTQVIDLKLD